MQDYMLTTEEYLQILKKVDASNLPEQGDELFPEDFLNAFGWASATAAYNFALEHIRKENATCKVVG